MSVEIEQIKLKENQNIIEIPEVGVFRFVEHTDDNLVCCWDCDVRKVGICNVAPCTMSSRSDYKEGIFKLLKNKNMSELEDKHLLKIRFVRASGKKTEFNLEKHQDYYCGLDANQLKEMEWELYSAFRSALYDAKEQRKNEVNVDFNV